MSEVAVIGERIVSRCTVEGECLIWPGALAGGYAPTMTYLGTSINVRRWLWESMGKTLKPGHVIASKCRDRRCVNPDHLVQQKSGPKPGHAWTPAARANLAKAMQARSHLTSEDVQAIRDSDEHRAVLAERFNTSRTNVRYIQQSRTWRPLNGPFSGLMPKVVR